jgi:putative SOS response-associated peptidase YedK
MCGGIEFRRRKPLEGGLGLLEPEDEQIRVLFPNPKAALLVDAEQNLWQPWGRRKEQPGDWPEGGWARAESLGKAYWTRWDPEEVIVRASRWMEKDRFGRSHWFELGRDGIRCLRLTKAPGTPLYVVTEPSHGDFAQVHDRMPVLIADS